MFTGLISDVAEVAQIESTGELSRVRIFSSYPAETISLGASIACNGPCLTVVEAESSGNRSF